MKAEFNIELLHRWFSQFARSFPWRENKDPYRVWISEVMLQQTRASVVIPYFLKWMKLFPTIESVAQAPLEKLIKAWEGLGYYNRVRQIHKTSQLIVNDYGGVFPNTKDELKKLFGFGPYMVEAMLSFAFYQKAAPLDGNVCRVLCRFFSLDLDISKNSSKNKLRVIEEKLLNDDFPWITAEALIELGATICNKKASCNICPLSENCLAYINRKVEHFPNNSKKYPLVKIKRAVFFLEAQNFFLIKKETHNLMKDLYEMPYLEFQSHLSLSTIEKEIKKRYNLSVSKIIKLKPLKQYFTKFEVKLFPYYVFIKKMKEINDFVWVDKKKAHELPLSSGHRKILQSLEIL